MTQIKDLQPGSYLNDARFGVISITERQTRENKPYLDITLTDSTGQINAKVWSNALDSVQIENGKVIILSGKVGEYQGNLDITINEGRVVEDEFDNYLSTVPTCVFDIETVGKEFEELEEWDQQYVLNNLEKNTEDKEEAKTKLGLYSLYGFVQSIGMYNPHSSRGVVLSLSNKPIVPENQDFEYYSFKYEKSLLEKFWELSKNYDRFVTYNGKGFDWPYLIIRSGINRVVVPFDVDHYNKSKFIDLQLKINQGRSFKLEAICRAFGITNPKEKGVSGLHVTHLYNQGDTQAIADYVARDAVSTSELYMLWRKYLSGSLNF